MVGLASSTAHDIVVQELTDAGLVDYFQAITGGDQISHSKPDPEIYLKACEKLGIDPKEAYAVEDSYNGIRSAFSAGMKPLMVPDLLPPTGEMEEKPTGLRRPSRSPRFPGRKIKGTVTKV